MNVDLNKLNDFNIFEAVHGGGLYRASLSKVMWSDYPYELRVWYVDDCGGKHDEFSNVYKTVGSALKKLERYFKGEKTEWTRL